MPIYGRQMERTQAGLYLIKWLSGIYAHAINLVGYCCGLIPAEGISLCGNKVLSNAEGGVSEIRQSSFRLLHFILLYF